MKILYINSLDKRYGSTYRSRHIVKALRELGHSVNYVESNFNQATSRDDISVRQKDSLLGYLGATVKRAQIVLQADYDILFIQKFIPLTIPALLVGKIKRKKCFVDWDDLDFCYQENIVKKMIVFVCEHIFPYWVDHITTHSNLLRSYAYRIGIKKVSIVNQVVDFENYAITAEEKQRLKERIGAKDKKIICFLGTLTSGGAGDLDVIIKAVSNVARLRNDVFFLIIGGGPLEEKVRKLLRNYNLGSMTYLTGLLPHNDVRKYLAISDLGLIYMRDNRGNKMRVSFKVLEYLSSNTPMVGKLVGETKNRFSQFCHYCDFEKFQKPDCILDFLARKVLIPVNHRFDEYALNQNKNSLSILLQDYETSRNN